MWILKLMLLLAPLAAPLSAWSAERAVLAEVEGSVAVSAQGDDEWLEAAPRKPLAPGDRIWADAGARAEVQAGPHRVNLAPRTRLALDALARGNAQWSLRQGSVAVQVGRLAEGENFEVGTPNLAARALQPGRWQLAVAPQGAATEVTVHEGSVRVFGADGQWRDLQAGATHRFAGRGLAQSQPAKQAATPPATQTLGAAPAAPPAVAEAARAQQQERARREAWQRQQKALAERWKREHEAYLRRHAAPAPPSPGIPIRRVL
jgi:hypothetical protein